MNKRRRRPADDPPNHDRWLISYADFITLLFAFFVVLFASAYRDNETVKNVAQAIRAGFQQLGAFSAGGRDGEAAYPNLPSLPSTAHPDDRAAVIKDEAIVRPTVDIAELQRQLEAAIGQEIKKHEVVMRITPEGFVISLNELGFFDSGRAVLLPGAAAKIQRIVRVLSQSGLNIRVEGHSDNQPIHTAQFRSNWELSTARATVVLLLLVDDSDFNPRNISVAGYGEYRPIADNSTSEGRRLNRRVDLVVVATANTHPAAQ
jgi:chemotaxis protein MotB